MLFPVEMALRSEDPPRQITIGLAVTADGVVHGWATKARLPATVKLQSKNFSGEKRFFIS